MKEISVDLGERSYPIIVGNTIFSSLPDLYVSKRLPKSVAIITDKNVAQLYLKQLMNGLRHHGCDVVPVVIPAGERQKTLSRTSRIFSELLANNIARTSAIVALGGGVTGDLAGFVAATFRRGIPFIQIPTTLLGQVESSIGGKVGINHHHIKNAIGAFYQPKFVFSDVALLSTLPKREIICGLGELIKYAYLTEEMFSFVQEHLADILALRLDVVEEAIVRCNMMKAKMISEDERDESISGGRMVLNLGHTVGQPIEVLSNYRLHHGEAVLIGLKMELALARYMGFIDQKMDEWMNELLERIPFSYKKNIFSKRMLIQATFGKHDKRKFILPKNIGKIESVEIDRKTFQSSLERRT